VSRVLGTILGFGFRITRYDMGELDMMTQKLLSRLRESSPTSIVWADREHIENHFRISPKYAFKKIISRFKFCRLRKKAD
jgi:hypothetical protein